MDVEEQRHRLLRHPLVLLPQALHHLEHRRALVRDRLQLVRDAQQPAGAVRDSLVQALLHDDGKVWLHTGDIGYIGEDGLVYFAQRLKRIIISSGYNIYPTHLESIINSHEAVLTSTVIGIDHHYKGQVPKAFIVLKPGYRPGKRLEREIRELLERNIPIYALPAAYEFRDKLPQTKVGKVAFRELEKEEKNKK